MFKSVLFFGVLSICPAMFGGQITSLCSSAGTLTYGASGSGAAARFVPTGGSLSSAASACLGTSAHFNWYQVVTSDPSPPQLVSVPYIDPQPGGNQSGSAYWRDGQPWYYDETLPTSGVTLCGSGSSVNCYSSTSWSVSSACITYKTGQTCSAYPSYSPSSDFLLFGDTPSNPDASITLSFQTRLVAVSNDLQTYAFIGGFSWNWSNLVSTLVGTASNFTAITGTDLNNPPAARQGGGFPPPFLDAPEAHSSLGDPPSPFATAVPEPSSIVLLALGLCPVLYRLQSRRG